MNAFMSLALYVVPISAALAGWAELFVTDTVELAGVPLVTATVAGCVCWMVKDSVDPNAIRTSLVYCFLGLLFAVFLVAPVVSSIGVTASLEELKRTNPNGYIFTVQSRGRAMNSVERSEHRWALKIAIPFGILSGLSIGAAITCLANAKCSDQTPECEPAKTA